MPDARLDRRIPGFDGLRGLAVLLVLAFHLRLRPFGGGFVGVTMFFTLSGFLITSRTLSEIDRNGTFAPGGFVERRIRRLAPASLLCVTGVVIATGLLGSAVQLGDLPGDAAAAVANVANWRFLLRDSSYAALFSAPSPLAHYWSLAIEEQFYALFPLVVWAVLRFARGRSRRMLIAAVVIAAMAGSLIAALGARRFDRFYYGTDARMFELLVGVTLALWIRRPRPTHARPRNIPPWIPPVALAVVVVEAIAVPNGSLAFARGLAQLAAVATAVAIAGLLEPGSIIESACSPRWLRWVGKVSYGAYLYHWPIVALSPKRLGPLSGTALSVAQLGLTFLLAAASWRYVEQPIVERRLLIARRRLLTNWAATTATVVAVALVAVPWLPRPKDVTATFLQAGKGLEPGDTVTITTALEGADPLRVAVTGDSTAEVFAKALGRYAEKHPAELTVLDLSMVACTITRVEKARHYEGEAGHVMSSCGQWATVIPQRVAEFDPDISLVFVAVMEQADQRPAGSNLWRNVGQPEWAAHQRSEFDVLTDQLHASGGPVLWADVPYVKFQADLPWVSDRPQRTDALNRLIAELVADRADVEPLALAEQLNRPDHSVDTATRPDGVHLSDAAADALVGRWLVPQIEDRVGR